MRHCAHGEQTTALAGRASRRGALPPVWTRTGSSYKKALHTLPRQGAESLSGEESRIARKGRVMSLAQRLLNDLLIRLALTRGEAVLSRKLVKVK